MRCSNLKDLFFFFNFTKRFNTKKMRFNTKMRFRLPKGKNEEMDWL